MTELGDVYFEKAGHFDASSVDASVLLDIAGTLDWYKGDVRKTLGDLTENRVHLYKQRLGNAAYTRQHNFYREYLDCFEKYLKELQEEYGDKSAWLEGYHPSSLIFLQILVLDKLFKIVYTY